MEPVATLVGFGWLRTRECGSAPANYRPVISPWPKHLCRPGLNLR